MDFDQFIRLLDTLKWPLAAIICMLVVAVLFRHQWASFLSRVTSISKEGIKTGATAGQQNESSSNHVKDLMHAFDSAILLEQERRIKADLEQRGLLNEGETTHVLIRHLAQAQIVSAFDDIYRQIFGSQIYLLKRANENRVLQASSAEEHFNSVKALFPEAFSDWNAERYMFFLISRGLLCLEGSDYTITVFGIEFLTWMAKIGALENKGL